jgi:hypothetical protein
MIDIATLRAMASAGASVDVILAAVEAMAEGVRVQASKNAARQQRWRDKRNVTLQSVTSHNVTSQVSLSSLLTSSESTSKQQESKKKERPRNRLLPDDWQPNQRHQVKATKNGHDLAQKADELRSWAKSKAVMRADWDATFDGFLRPKEATNGTAHRKSPSERAYALADKIEQYELTAGVGRSPDGRGSDTPRR